MLTKTELENRCNPDVASVAGVSTSSTFTARETTASSNARRLRRQRRQAEGSYRAATGWTTGLW